MANQYKVSPGAELEVRYYYFFCHYSQKKLAKKLRLNCKTIKRIIKNDQN